ncbi:hypothetical protein GCM10007063_07180 [Lentibacillus kapialis]|uniref:Uncharacterized protein n=1 Tax=Lentibacillus kapialis TaxID=340214 RepID=A0A917PPT4_9BACI|nr:hypothetical protein [Lentibacillus kapialis]GGJ87256.1 hypothetical protein GCM10007063_07180 [Lentibacillus kapialis]
MFNLGLVIGISILVAIMIVNIIITLASSDEGFGIYIPAAVAFVAGIIMVTMSSFAKIEMIGLGFGGWGGASLFAAAIGAIATSLVETFRHA